MYDNSINSYYNTANDYTNRYLGNNSTGTDNNFGLLLAQMLQKNMNSSLASVGDFSNFGSNSGSSNLFSNSNNSGISSMLGMGGMGDMGSMSGMSNIFGSSNGLSSLSLLSGLYGGDMFSGMNSMFGNNSSNSLGGNMMMLLSILTLNNVFSNYSYNGYGNSMYQNQAVSAYQTAKSALVTPTEAWKEASGGVQSVAGRRSAQQYTAVVNQFDVENNGRYAPRNGNTYCNIFAWDVTKAMGAEIPHYTDASGKIVSSGTSGAKAMTANAMSEWLNGSAGKGYGWKKVTAEQAQAYANAGKPSVVVNHNSSGGHISVVIPSTDGRYNATKGVRIAQAGSNLVQSGYITDVYSANRMKQVEYFVHE